jgi:hypothetical protein
MGAPAPAMTDPRRPGGRYLSAYWRLEYDVTATEIRRGTLWVTCTWLPPGPDSHPLVSRQYAEDPMRTTVHCTPWDPRRDIVIRQPGD